MTKSFLPPKMNECSQKEDRFKRKQDHLLQASGFREVHLLGIIPSP